MALNLRSQFTTFPGNLYSGSIALNFDVAVFADVLSLYNPTGSGKTAYIIAATFSARSDGQARNMTLNFSRGVKTAVGTTVVPSKLDTGYSNNVAQLNFGGTWTIGTRIESRTLSSPTETIDVNIPSPIILREGEGALFYIESESGAQTFVPSASIVWYEV